jgi:AAA15 family ATPase/GTPase
VENAWSGKVTQSVDLLSVEDARKALFIADLTSKNLVDHNVPNIPFSSKLFDFNPEKLVSVFYGANGSGKTTVMQLVNGFSSILKPLLDQHSNQIARGASLADLSDWSNGVIPKEFQDEKNPRCIKFLHFENNPLIANITSSMARRRNPPFSSPFESIDWRSKFRFAMEGVCVTPELWDLTEDESKKVTIDSRYKIELLPTNGVLCIDSNGLIKDNEKMIENFEGAFYALRIESTSFENHIQSSIGKEHDGPMMEIKETNDETLQHSMKYEIPLMIHPDGGVLVMSRTVMDFSELWNPEDSERTELFSGIEEEDIVVMNEEKKSHLPLLHYMLERPYLADEYGFSDFFNSLYEVSASTEERNCQFSRQMMYELFSEGTRSDFFLSFDTMPTYRGRKGNMALPSLLEKSHFERWEETLESREEASFEWGVDHCNGSDFYDLAISLQSEYIWPSNYIPKKLKMPPKKVGRFTNLDVLDNRAVFDHARLILNTPDTAYDAITEFLSMTFDSSNIESLYDAFAELKSLIPKYRQDSKRYGNTIDSFLFGKIVWEQSNNCHPFDWLMEKYSESFTTKGFDEEHAKIAAQSEIRHLIQNGLEQIWFQELEQHVVSNRFELMNQLLEKYLNICVLEPNQGFNPNRLLIRKNTDKPPPRHGRLKPNMALNQFSSGMKNLFNLIMALGNTEIKGPLLIDEPEISLHIDWEYALKEIATSLADSTKRQIIFSTHSPDLIMNFGDRSKVFLSEHEHDGE